MPRSKPTVPKASNADAERFMLEKLKASALTAADAKALGYQPCTADQSAALGLQRIGAGFKLPYYSATGKLLKMFRYRYQVTEVASGFTKGTKLHKYDQPKDTPPELYLPWFKGNIPWNDVQQRADIPVHITEGELKAACATKHGFLTIGVGGVYSFGSKKLYQELIPALEEFNWKDRNVYIIYDSDAATNPKVVLAENRLARQLTDRGALAYIVRLPEQRDNNKLGLDDFIVSLGKDALTNLINATEPWADSAELYKLNEEVVYVKHPSMVVVLPTLTLPKFMPAKVSDFSSAMFATRKIKVVNPMTGTELIKSAPAEWIKWPNRNNVSEVAYEPGQPLYMREKLNMWPGWGVQPAEGDVRPWLQLMDNHFPKGMEDIRHWFHQWLAYPLQHPGAKLNTACVVWSLEQGNGKSSIGATMSKIYGANSGVVTKPELNSQFNSWTANKQFITGEEITGGNSREAADILKHLITGEELIINEKNVPRYTIKNCVNYYFTSNHKDAFFLDSTDRRFFIHELTQPKLDSVFWTRYRDWKMGVGPAALFHFLLTYNLGGFNPDAAAPVTQAKQEMIDANLSEHMAWCKQLAEYPDNILRAPGMAVGGKQPILPFKLWSVEDLMALYAPPMGQRRPISPKAMTMALTAVGFQQVNGKQPVYLSDGTRKRLWAIRDKAQSALGMEAGKAYEDERTVLARLPKFATTKEKK